ncbi:MAG: O-methyltransferase, partial [Thermodesulfobacteriota bacterium]
MKKFYADIVDPKIDKYISDLYGESTSIFKEMEDYAASNEVPIVGPLVGRLLSQISLIKQPQKLFELGSGFGYSALWFSISLSENAKITCSDFAKEKADLALDYFKRAGVDKSINFLTGNSLDLLKNSKEKFDIIFNDVDKDYYPDVIDIAYEKLNSGGMLIS